MNIDKKIYVIVGILSTVLAQISLKRAGAYNVFQFKWVVFLSLSLLTYAISFISYYMALKFYDISKIQPIMMASIATVIVLYGFAVGEVINHFRIAGILFAIVSIYFLSKT